MMQAAVRMIIVNMSLCCMYCTSSNRKATVFSMQGMSSVVLSPDRWRTFACSTWLLFKLP